MSPATIFSIRGRSRLTFGMENAGASSLRTRVWAGGSRLTSASARAQPRPRRGVSGPTASALLNLGSVNTALTASYWVTSHASRP
jgi:hypothetical protein